VKQVVIGKSRDKGLEMDDKMLANRAVMFVSCREKEQYAKSA
jgi:hypothetical protein